MGLQRLPPPQTAARRGGQSEGNEKRIQRIPKDPKCVSK